VKSDTASALAKKLEGSAINIIPKEDYKLWGIVEKDTSAKNPLGNMPIYFGIGIVLAIVVGGTIYLKKKKS
jgi:hypothetical protein